MERPNVIVNSLLSWSKFLLSTIMLSRAVISTKKWIKTGSDISVALKYTFFGATVNRISSRSFKAFWISVPLD